MRSCFGRSHPRRAIQFWLIMEFPWCWKFMLCAKKVYKGGRGTRKKENGNEGRDEGEGGGHV